MGSGLPAPVQHTSCRLFLRDLMQRKYRNKLISTPSHKIALNRIKSRLLALSRIDDSLIALHR